MLFNEIEKVADLIRNARYAVAFTGAGISVDSGIPAFRGEDGLWNSHHPIYLEIDFFHKKRVLRLYKNLTIKQKKIIF